MYENAVLRIHAGKSPSDGNDRSSQTVRHVILCRGAWFVNWSSGHKIVNLEPVYINPGWTRVTGKKRVGLTCDLSLIK
jgi:hypothetical protein